MLTGTSFAQGRLADSLRGTLSTTATDSSRFETLLSIGIAWDGENTDSALHYHNLAKELALKTGNRIGVGEAMRHIGWDHFAAGDFIRSLAVYEEVTRLIKELYTNADLSKARIKKLEIVVTGNIGSINLSRGDYKKALAYYLQSLKITEETNNVDYQSVVTGNIGLLYENMEDHAKALEYLNRSLSLSKRSGNRTQQANSLSNIGLVYRNMDKMPEAIIQYNAAMALDSSLGDRRGVADELGNIGLVYIDLGVAVQERCKCANDSGNFSRGLYYSLRALKIMQETGFKDHEAVMLGNIGFLYYSMNKYAQALDYFKQSLQLANELGSLDDIKEVHGNFARVYEKQGKYAEAMRHYKLFIQYRDSLLNEENTKKTVQLEMQYEFDKKEAAVKLEQEKKDAVALADKRRQRIVLLAISGFGLLVLGFAVFAYRSFLQKKRANIEIMRQKELIEEKQKEILDSIFYARRIQSALMPHEKYIERRLKLLNKT